MDHFPELNEKKMIINKINFKQFIWFIGKKNDEKKNNICIHVFFCVYQWLEQNK